MVRATLEFVAAAQLEGSAADSFAVVAYPVIADFGAKSPLSAGNLDTTWISIAALDTVRIPFRINGDIVDIHDARASGPSLKAA